MTDHQPTTARAVLTYGQIAKNAIPRLAHPGSSFRNRWADAEGYLVVGCELF